VPGDDGRVLGLSRHLGRDAEVGDVFVDRAAHVLFDFVAVGVIDDGEVVEPFGRHMDRRDVHLILLPGNSAAQLV
jgi:hypothetical protein